MYFIFYHIYNNNKMIFMIASLYRIRSKFTCVTTPDMGRVFVCFT